ncbi:nicotinamide riboside transporter PnuC [uncultured Clostridium sp.]|uniref:nicotinamide riboside transporter PnuC n=1 Tax=uncultured Clostridium sp. TaxID=59620 RepID=UPI00260F8CDF|nr:nicotinamide riboside transporter PnuC [uncultured Clostridium sp.]
MENSKKFTPFQRGFIIIFIIISVCVFLLPAWTHTSTWTEVFGVVSIISLISAVSGVFNSMYIARADILCYFFWIINTLTYAFVAYEQQFYGQVIQNIVFIFPLEVIGLIAWTKALKKKKEENKEDEGIDVKKFGAKEWILTVIGLAIFWLAYGVFLYFLPDIMKSVFNIKIAADSDLFLDSLVAVLTIYAVWLTGARFLEQWTFWLLSNGIGVILFLIPVFEQLSKGQFNVATLSGAVGWIQYLTSAVYGFICWRAMYNAKQKKAAKAV